jgi:hypothetical protein
MVAFRLDPRLRGRVDPSDVLQEGVPIATEKKPTIFAGTWQVRLRVAD